MISKRYGKALLLLAEEKNLIDQFEKDLIDINATINADENLKQIWLSFRIGPSAKRIL